MNKKNKLLISSGIFLVILFIAFKIFLDSVYRLPILMYHRIDYTSDRKDKMTVSPDIFARQIKYLHDNKYNMVALETAVSYIKDKKRPPPKTVAITMDDGYENNYKYAYPVLKRYHIPATIFVIVDVVGKKGFLNWNEIREMSGSGIIDIESHTKSHPWLTFIDDKRIESELADSKRILEKEIGKKIKFICYPMGYYNEHVKSMAKGAGYEAAFATKPTRIAPNYDVYEIKRVRISPTANNLFVYWIKLSGYHAFFRILHDESKDATLVK